MQSLDNNYIIQKYRSLPLHQKRSCQLGMAVAIFTVIGYAVAEKMGLNRVVRAGVVGTGSVVSCTLFYKSLGREKSSLVRHRPESSLSTVDHRAASSQSETKQSLQVKEDLTKHPLYLQFVTIFTAEQVERMIINVTKAGLYPLDGLKGVNDGQIMQFTEAVAGPTPSISLQKRRHEHVYLSANPEITDKSARSLALLIRFSNIGDLSLSNTKMTWEGMVVLLEELVSEKTTPLTLRMLSFSPDRAPSAEEREKFIHLVKQVPLEFFNLYDQYPLNEEGRKLVQEIFQQTSIQFMYLSHAYAWDEEIQKVLKKQIVRRQTKSESCTIAYMKGNTPYCLELDWTIMEDKPKEQYFVERMIGMF
jgi:hypothetical protein